MVKTSRTPTLPKSANDILKARWAFHPTSAAGQGLHAFDGLLPTYTRAAIRRRAAQIGRQLVGLERVEKKDRLSPRQSLELGVLKGALLTERFELLDGREPHTTPPYFLFRLSIENYLLRNYAPLDRRLRAVARLQAQIPRYLKEFRSTCDRRLADTCYEMAVMATNGILDAYAKELPDVAAKASLPVRKALEKTNVAAQAELRRLSEDLASKYKPRIKTDFALGRRKYERMILAEHLVPIPIDRLLDVGIADLRENEARLREVTQRIDPSKTAAQILEEVMQDHPTADRLLEDTRAMLEEIRQFLIDGDVVTVPSEERAQVIETPRFFRFATAAMNSPGSYETVAREAYYYVTPVEDSWPPEKQKEWLRHLNVASLRNISVHECYPGHYVHFLHQRRVGSRILKSYYSYAFTEGWAHYCEEMMIEQGFGDLRLRVVQLQDALLRNCRYISSIRMHTGGWTWEDATRFFMEKAHLDRLPAEREAKRGTWDPGYLNYTLGKLMIKKLRSDWFAQRRGSSLREFHDALLALGAPPLGPAREHLLGRDAGPAL